MGVTMTKCAKRKRLRGATTPQVIRHFVVFLTAIRSVACRGDLRPKSSASEQYKREEVTSAVYDHVGADVVSTFTSLSSHDESSSTRTDTFQQSTNSRKYTKERRTTDVLDRPRFRGIRSIYQPKETDASMQNSTAATRDAHYSTTRTMQMLLLYTNTNLLVDTYAFAWEQLTSNQILHFWNEQQTNTSIYVDQVDTTLLSRIRVTEHFDLASWNKRLGHSWRRLQEANNHAMGLTSASNSILSYPLLLEYNQTIRYAILDPHLLQVDDDAADNEWLFRKPFVEEATTAVYMMQLTALANNSRSIELHSVKTIEAEQSRPRTQQSNGTNSDGEQADGGPKTSRQVKIVISVTVVLMLLCLVIWTCRCD